MVVVQACKETGHCSDSTRECDAHGYLLRHDPNDETWDHDQAQNPENEHWHPHPRTLGTSGGCLVKFVLAACRRLAALLRIFIFNRGGEVVIEGRLLKSALGALAGVRDLFVVGSLEVEVD